MSRTFDDIVNALDHGGWLTADPTGRTEIRAQCPAHNGQDDNLSVFTGADGHVGVKCYSKDCTTEAIYRALRLWRELVPALPGTVRYEARTIADPTKVVACHVVTNKPGKSKSVHWDPEKVVKADQLVLYRSWDLKPTDTTVVVCEGERATEVLITAGFAAVGTQCGASTQPADAALKVLQGRDVVLWPDADTVGRKHMEGIARRLGVCRAIDVSGAPEGWDAADASVEDICRSVARAQAYVPGAHVMKSAKESAATHLVNLAHARGVELFRDPAGVTYLADGHAVKPFAGGGVSSWLSGLAWEAENWGPGERAVKDAMSTLEAEARHAGAVEEVYLRVGPVPGGIALDLGTDDFTAAIVRAAGWTIELHPARFRRPPTMGALPIPLRGGSLSDLTKLMNLGDDRQTRLLIGFLIGCLNPTGPYALLSLTGEQGSAKSFTARLTRAMIDPVVEGNGLKTLTKSDDAFWTFAYHSWLPTFDNVSGLTAEQSDRLAQLATGGGRSDRKKYSDGEEYTQSACRPAILNGIEVAERSDLLSRTIALTLPRIQGGWTVEKHLTAEFDALHPFLLGALLDVMVGVVGRIDSLPETGWNARMADHVSWVTAAEPALGWKDRSYEALFAEGQDVLMLEAAEGIVWLPELHVLLANGGGHWSGGAGDLRNQLINAATSLSGDKLPDGAKGWPSSGQGMTNALKRHETSLRVSGIVHGTERNVHTKQNVHHLSYDPTGPQAWRCVAAGTAGTAGTADGVSSFGSNQEEEREREAPARATANDEPSETTPAAPAAPADDEAMAALF
jgi:5S rRNA maturation endonuclease (ribonuclease M5)